MFETFVLPEQFDMVIRFGPEYYVNAFSKIQIMPSLLEIYGQNPLDVFSDISDFSYKSTIERVVNKL